jgi:hypothetical protein
MFPQEFAERRRCHAATAAAIRTQLRSLQRRGSGCSSGAACPHDVELRLGQLVRRALAELKDLTQLKADVLSG